MKKIDPSIIVLTGQREYSRRTLQLINEAEELNTSGEYKAHRVYARLLKEFPNIKRSDLRLEIELLQGLKNGRAD